MIYLDNAATTIPHKEVVDLVINMLRDNTWANPNSQYDIAVDNRNLINNTKKIIASKINADVDEIIITQSASAANSLAICGYLNKHDECHNWVTSGLEHASISKIEVKDKNKYIINPNKDGFIKYEDLEQYHNCLVSIIGASNEIGTIQDLIELSKIVHKNNNIFHSDLTQYLPSIPVDVKKLNLDMATFGSHKIHGLKNCGVLYVKKGIELSPLIFGNDGLVSGTPDIYQICAMGKAFELLNYDNVSELKKKRNYLLNKLLEIDGVYLNGSKEKRLVNNINIRIENTTLDSQQIVAIMNLYGYCISGGSACASSEKKPSEVLMAIGLSAIQANSSVRITISKDNTYEELDKFYNDFKNVIEQFRV